MRVLAADDNSISQTVLSSMLQKWGYDVVSDRDQAMAGIVFAPAAQHGHSGLDDAGRGWRGDMPPLARSRRGTIHIHFAAYVTRSDLKDVVEALDAGADDYLSRPFNSSELRARLRADCRIVELQQPLLAAQKELRLRAMHDGLTGLLNRAAIMDICAVSWPPCSRENRPISVVMAELEKFKHVNDSFGHQAGAAVLKKAAAHMCSSFRCYDSVGRYGGEEFLAVLPACDEDAVWSLGERFRLLISVSPFIFGQSVLAITCSIGCATQPAGDFWDGDSMIRLAHEALYDAKNTGRNRTISASHQLALQ